LLVEIDFFSFIIKMFHNQIMYMYNV
jgi:hypothetical protein